MDKTYYFNDLYPLQDRALQVISQAQMRVVNRLVFIHLIWHDDSARSQNKIGKR